MDINDLVTYLLTPAAQIALIIGLAELVKKIGLEAKWIPLVDVALGIVSGVCVYGLHMDYGILNGILVGMFIGLSACGLFSGVKNVTEAVRQDADG